MSQRTAEEIAKSIASKSWNECVSWIREYDQRVFGLEVGPLPIPLQDATESIKQALLTFAAQEVRKEAEALAEALEPIVAVEQTGILTPQMFIDAKEVITSYRSRYPKPKEKP